MQLIGTLLLATAGGADADAAVGRWQRAPLWRGVDEITLACDVRAAGTSDDFCAAALVEARRGAPYPVRLADGSAGIATLALRLSLTSEGGVRALTITGERAVAIDEAQGALLPRVTRATPGEAVERSLTRAFDAALPWRLARAGGASMSRC